MQLSSIRKKKKKSTPLNPQIGATRIISSNSQTGLLTPQRLIT